MSEDAETEALRQRLQAKDNALRSLTKRYLSYQAAIESSSAEEAETLYQGLMLELDQFELAVSKSDALVNTNVRQVAEYDVMQQRVEAEMETTRADIERLTKVLEQERVNRQQKEQYSALAKRIHAYPSRDDTQAEIARLNEEIAGLKNENDAVQGQLELRSKRFAGFMHALHDVSLLLDSEGGEGAPATD